ncbi:MAG TPA: hypothetical protein VGJ33_12045 [Candidatus Angelobacter sp.]
MQRNFKVVLTLLLVLFTGRLCQGQLTTTPPAPIDLGPSAVGVSTGFSNGLTDVVFKNTGTATLTITTASFSPLVAGFTSESTMPPQPVIMGPGETKETNIFWGAAVPGKNTIQLTLGDNTFSGQEVFVLTGTGFTVPANDDAVVLDPNAPASISVPSGGSSTFVVWALAGSGLSNFSASLQCAGTAGITCSFDHNPNLDLSNGIRPVGRDKIVVTVTAPAQTAALRPVGRFTAWMCGFGVLAIVFCGKNRAMLTTVVLAVVCLSVVSCGGSGSTARGPQSLMITATPATGSSGGGTHTLTVPIVVQ